jgi:ankyrin repeat protein
MGESATCKIKSRIAEDVTWHFEDFLKLPDVDISFDNNKLFRRAVEYGKIDIIKLLLNDSRFNPDNHLVTKMIFRHFQSDILKLLIEYHRIDINPFCSQLFTYACNIGDTEMINLLLIHSKLDPTILNNNGILTAHNNGHLETVKYLLHCPEVMLSLIKNKELSLLKIACADIEILLYYTFRGIKILLN